MKCRCGNHGLVLNAKPKAKRRVSAFKMDPTRTLHIREAFQAEIRRRFRRFKDNLWDFLVTKDALGLKKGEQPVHNVEPREYQFLTDSQKLAQFNLWLQRQIEIDLFNADFTTGVLRIGSGTGLGFGGSMGTGPWTAKYIESSYKKGLINAYLASRRGLESDDPNYIADSQEQFLRESFLAPERLSKVQLLASRPFEQLKGISAQIGSQLNTILAQGMIDGIGVISLANEMTDRVDSLSNSRAMTIARTEVIHAHAEGQLDGFEDLGVEELGVEAEWSTAGDGRVCPVCAALEGKTFSVDEARGRIPQHPNCRCTWIPKILDSK